MNEAYPNQVPCSTYSLTFVIYPSRTPNCCPRAPPTLECDDSSSSRYFPSAQLYTGRAYGLDRELAPTPPKMGRQFALSAGLLALSLQSVGPRSWIVLSNCCYWFPLGDSILCNARYIQSKKSISGSKKSISATALSEYFRSRREYFIE